MNSYPHMCRDGHPEIGHSGDDEVCPLCKAQAEIEHLRSLAGAVSDGQSMADIKRELREGDTMAKAYDIPQTPITDALREGAARAGKSLKEYVADILRTADIGEE